MADRARRAEARVQRQKEAVGALAAIEDPMDEEDSDDNEEKEEAPVRVPQKRVRGPAMSPPLALDPGIRLNMVNLKPPYLADLKIESMKKFIFDHKRYSHKFPRQFLCNSECCRFQNLRGFGNFEPSESKSPALFVLYHR